MKGTNNEQVTGGTVTMAISAFGRQIKQEELKVCGDSEIDLPLGMGHIAVHGLTCPSAAGALTLTQEVTLPSFMPAPSSSARHREGPERQQPLLHGHHDLEGQDVHGP